MNELECFTHAYSCHILALLRQCCIMYVCVGCACTCLALLMDHLSLCGVCVYILCVQIYMIAVDQPDDVQRRLSSHATLYIQICDDIFEDPRIQDVSVLWCT